MPKVEFLKKTIVYLVLILMAIFILFPMAWMVITSIKLRKDAFTISFIPFLHFEPTLNNWISELSLTGRSGIAAAAAGPRNYKAMIDSTIIGLSSAALATLLGIFAGYALARYEFKKWKNIDIITFFLSLRFLPPISVAIPFYVMVKYANLFDTHLAVILIHTACFMPYAVLVLRDSFKSLPIELEEAAMVDGASVLTILWRIALPLVAPAIAAVFILLFAFSWNEFLLAFILTSSAVIPMPVRLASTVATEGALVWIVCVRQILGILPPLLLAILIHRYIVTGLTLGAIKG
ncbi:carbohydrate ABC transporter permease [Candidatus Bathyarchaeota archaeon]|nr:MAG: carbohydrate ABC transporter permease [Candidatus Bathyarchaeota archaeon]